MPIMLLFCWWLRTKVAGYEMTSSLFLGFLICSNMLIFPIVWSIIWLKERTKTNKLNYKNASTFKIKAKVLSKSFSVGGRYAHTFCFISFEFFDGTRKNFSTNINQYNTIIENEEGLLTYKENGNNIWFIDFQPIK